MSSPRHTFRRAGFTLAELLVGLAVTSIVMTAVVAIFIGVQRSYQAETEVKQMTENGRGAMLFLERVLPMAGYGIDPRLAFDMATPTAGGKDNDAVAGVSVVANTAKTDDLAFRYRDPAFLVGGKLVGTTLTVTPNLNVGIPVGKLLMVGCRGGIDYQMVRVTAAAAAGDGSITVGFAGSPFVSSSNNCLSVTGSAAPYVYMIHEHRLRIVPINGRPWLVSFRDLRADVTVLTGNNFDPIAPDVEVFQVAYGINRARATLTCCTTAPDTGGTPNTNFIMGDELTEGIVANPTGVLSTLPDYRAGYDDPSRYVSHPANIRSVHVAMVMRSSRALPDGRRDFTSADVFNWDSPTPARDGFKRTFFHTALNTPNLISRSGFAPALRSSADLRDLNSWGG